MYSRPFDDHRQPCSLRSRYVTLTLVLAIVVISIVLAFYKDIISTKQSVAEHLSVIQADHDTLNTIKIDLIAIYRNIDLFLLDPSQGNHAETANKLISSSLDKVNDFSSRHPFNGKGLRKKSAPLATKLSQLRDSFAALTALRMDIGRQYPGMAISAFEMTAPQHNISNNLQLLIEEIESGSLEPKAKELYPLLLKSKTLWALQISQVRIYMANRLASFSTVLLISQATSLNHLHQKFLDNIKKLTHLYSSEDSFDGKTVLQSLIKDTADWFTLFGQLRAVSESGKWRGDSYTMKTVIIPLTDEISSAITHLEKWLTLREDTITEQLRKNSDTLSTLLFSIIGLFMLFTLGLIFSLDMMVFRPIASVTEALRSKAYNQESPALEVSDSREIRYLVEAFQQMDVEVNQRQNALEHQALHDYLTGLPNRFMLNQHIENQLITAARSKQSFTLFLMDLDNFKDINDSLGHAAGDTLLHKVARELTEAVQESATVARLGGDEFAILLPDTTKDDSQKLAHTLLHTLQQPFSLEGKMIGVGLSIGIVSYPSDGTDIKSLLQHADIAMYHAKRHKTGFSFYNSNKDFFEENRLSLISDLKSAINSDTLDIHFQPQIDVKTKQVCGAEALLRWRHPKYGEIPPDKTIELAEYAGIIHQLSLWVLDTAIEQCAAWQNSGHSLSVSVNLSVQDLANPDLTRQIDQLLEQHSLSPHDLTLEITESGMMENPKRSINVLKALSKMGINLAIDDFGTGFSSLSYLKKLPVNTIKIDQSFVLDMDHNESDEIIVQSTIQLGHNLGLKVIAEGIEHQDLLDIASHYDCDEVQGFLFGQPQQAAEFLEFLAQTRQGDDGLQPAKQPA